jgi:thermolabile hemolysin
LSVPLYDFAVGGAASDIAQVVIPGLLQQVDTWKDYKPDMRNYNIANTLFTVLVGANDLISYKRTVAKIVADENSTISTLLNNGATNILIIGLPDVTQAPAFHMGREGGRDLQLQVKELNSKLETLVENYRLVNINKSTKINIQFYDLTQVSEDIMHDPAKYGFMNTNDTCLDISVGTTGYLQSHKLRPGCDPNRYLFWDTLHPTTANHKVMAKLVTEFVKQNFQL